MTCCCGICSCPCTNIIATISGCTEINGDYTLAPDTQYGSQCLYSVSTGGVTIKFNCRTNQIVFDYGAEHFAEEATVESESPWARSASGTIDCDGSPVSLFIDLVCDGTPPGDCVCCGFDGSETITASLSIDEAGCSLDGKTIEMTSDATEPLTWIGQITDLELSGHNWIIYLKCNGDGTWTAGFGCDDMDGDAFQTVPVSCYPFEGFQFWFDIAQTQTQCDEDCSAATSPLNITFTSTSGSSACRNCCLWEQTEGNHPLSIDIEVVDSDCAAWIGETANLEYQTSPPGGAEFYLIGDLSLECADPGLGGSPLTKTIFISCDEDNTGEGFIMGESGGNPANYVDLTYACDPFTILGEYTIVFDSKCDTSGCNSVTVAITAVNW